MEEFNKDKYIFSTVPGMIDIGEKARSIREKQISLMIKELFLYKVVIKDLAGLNPSYKDRNMILNVAYFIISDVDLYEKVQRRRELPFNIIGKRTKVSRGFLELWQDYILAYMIILANPNYKLIQDYIRITIVGGMNSLIPTGEKSDKEYKGIVLKDLKRSAIILSSSGEIVKVKVNDGCLLGKEICGVERTGVKHYRIHIAIAIVVLMFAGFSVYKQYTTESSIIMLQTSSQVKMKINKFNKVIYCYSPTGKGKELISTVSPLDEDIDSVIQKSIEFASENEMIPKDGILITVSGEPLKYGILEKTGDYIVENKINVSVNNAGSEHKLYESTIRQKEEHDESKK